MKLKIKEDRIKFNQTLDTLIALSTKTSNDAIDLIIWPESSISNRFSINERYNYQESEIMTNFLRSSNFSVVAGSDLRYDKKRYNSAILFESDAVKNVYHKQRLIPNVEYTPGIFTMLGFNTLGLLNFDIGKEFSMFNVKNIDFTTMVCIESIFPTPTRNFVNNGAQFITYIVNDGWYEYNPEPAQHARRCIFRAIENRRSVVRCANTGISMIVDPYGNITDRKDLNTKGVIEGDILISNEKTFYTKYGDLFSIFNLIVLLSAMLLTIFKVFYRKKHED